MNMSKWKPMKTAPKGEVFFGCMNGVLALCCIEEDEEQVVTGKFWNKKTETKKVSYLYLAIPRGKSYSLLNLRPDSGFYPTHWRSLRDFEGPPTEKNTMGTLGHHGRGAV